MITVGFGIFLVLHGLVHLLYLGQSRRLFELQAGMVWPDGSWAFSKLVDNDATRGLASVSCLLATIGFVAGGAALLFGQAWWQPMAVGAAAFSGALFLLFWDGTMQKLDDQGGVALLIDVAILAALIFVQWPSFG